MEGPNVIDVRVPIGTRRSGSGTLLVEERPLVVAADAAPPLPVADGVRLWVWRVTVALVVLLVVAGLLAFASTPPPV
jgi:hypothetical protein